MTATMTDTDTRRDGTDRLVDAFMNTERVISQMRAQQLLLLARIDSDQVPAGDGARTLSDWIADRLDVGPEMSRSLVQAMKLAAEHPGAMDGLSSGDISFERALVTAQFAGSGAAPTEVTASANRDIVGVRRLIAHRRSITPRDERDVYAERFVVLQPSLDESHWRLYGQLAAVDGQIVDHALVRRADTLPDAPEPLSRPQRNADALVSIALDTVDPTTPDSDSTSGAPVVTVFVDAQVAAATRGQTGAALAAGPRVGPETLRELLCTGKVQIIEATATAPVRATATTRTIPPAIRRFVLERDGGCVIAGCSSRYRLEPHHTEL